MQYAKICKAYLPSPVPKYSYQRVAGRKSVCHAISDSCSQAAVGAVYGSEHPDYIRLYNVTSTRYRLQMSQIFLLDLNWLDDDTRILPPGRMQDSARCRWGAVELMGLIET